MNCALAGALAEELRVNRTDLTQRWLERIAARVPIDPMRIFPTEELLDHVPLLIDGIAEYLEDPADEISADMPVIAKAMELGALRHEQGFDAHEILKEYELLGGVLYAFLVRSVDGIEQPCTRGELLACAHRLFRAIAIIQQVTTAHFLSLAAERVREREERLRGFNRTVSHELKNRLGAVLGGAQMLEEEWIRGDPAQVQRFSRIVATNAAAMQAVLQDLLSLSRTDSDSRTQRRILLPRAVAEVVRQLRELAAQRAVTIRVQPDLPKLEVNASALELCLSNYISNAIKYSDEALDDRWVEVGSAVERGDGSAELVVWVRDNGLGVPADQRDRLFQRFFRAAVSNSGEIEGTGLGLSIVRETIETLGGRAWAEFPDDRGSVFKLAVPLRREADADERARAVVEAGSAL